MSEKIDIRKDSSLETVGYVIKINGKEYEAGNGRVVFPDQLKADIQATLIRKEDNTLDVQVVPFKDAR